MKTALRLYFGRIVTSGMDHIDNGKPTLILANHTASFMDAIIVACLIKRRIHFFARGDVFKKKWADKILRSFGLLPVYRLSEGRENMGLNDSSNEEAMKILSKGGAVLIFCEGTSDIAKVLKPLKKGPFRLAVNAAEMLDEAPVLLPLGINYVTPTKPFGDVFLNAALPISIEYLNAGTAADFAKTATDLMRQLAVELRPLVWHVEGNENIVLVDKLLLNLKKVKEKYSFADTQYLIRMLNAGKLPARWSRQDVKALIRQTGGENGGGFQRQQLLLAVGLPFAVIAILGHILPVQLAKALANSKVKEPDFWAPVFLSAAVLAIIGWYLLLIILGVAFGAIWQIIALMVILPLTGAFYLKILRPAMEKGELDEA